MARKRVTVQWSQSTGTLSISGLRTRLYSAVPDEVEWKCTGCSMAVDFGGGSYPEGTPFYDAIGNPVTHYNVAKGATRLSGPPTAGLGQGEAGHRYKMTISTAPGAPAIVVDPDVVVDDGPPRGGSSKKKSSKRASSKKRSSKKSAGRKKK